MVNAVTVIAPAPLAPPAPGVPGVPRVPRVRKPTVLAALRSVFATKPVSAKRRAIALAIALAADVLQVVLMPAFVEGAASPFDDALDLGVGAALWIALGMSPRLAAAFALELVPGADLFPTWTAFVMSLSVLPAALPGPQVIDAPSESPAPK